MQNNLRIFFQNKILLTAQLIICLIFIYVFIKINITISVALNNIKKETYRSERLQKILDTIQQNHISNLVANPFHANHDTLKVNGVKGSNTLLKESIISIPFNKTPKKTNALEPIIVNENGNVKNATSKEIIQRLSYQCNLSENLLKLNQFDNVMLLTALIELTHPGSSYFSVQEVYEKESGENASKMIYFDCVKSIINKDSTIDFRFIEKRNDNLESLDPLNYDKNFGIVLKGQLYTPTINCILFWKDIGGRPYSAKLKLQRKK